MKIEQTNKVETQHYFPINTMVMAPLTRVEQGHTLSHVNVKYGKIWTVQSKHKDDQDLHLPILVLE